MIQVAEALSQQVGVKRACEELGVPRSRLYRAHQPEDTSAVPTGVERRGTAGGAGRAEQ